MAGAAGLGLGAALLRGGAAPAPASANSAADTKHLVWVWQFSTDAEPNLIGARLLEHNLGIVLKTHDGVHWMNEYDKSPYAVSGPAQVGVLANYYESAGIPFHAWCVVQGIDPIKEARMAADVLNNGARSIFLDLEPHSGFWAGTPADAVTYGKELRRLAPNGEIILSIDPRPWMVSRLPMKEFASFGNAIAPQEYWRTFDTTANYERFTESGFPVGPGGMTPEFLFQVSKAVLTPFGLPIVPTGQGNTPDAGEWRRYIDLAFAAGSKIVTAWRYGVMPPEVFKMLRDLRPPVPVIPAPNVPLVSGQAGIYIVKAGDTMGGIAAAHGIGVQQLLDANGLTDPNYIYVGQELRIPGSEAVAAAGAPAEGADVQTLSAAQAPAPRTHTVESGDTLYGVAGKYGSSVDAIMQASGLSDPNVLSIGQVLYIP